MRIWSQGTRELFAFAGLYVLLNATVAVPAAYAIRYDAEATLEQGVARAQARRSHDADAERSAHAPRWGQRPDPADGAFGPDELKYWEALAAQAPAVLPPQPAPPEALLFTAQVPQATAAGRSAAMPQGP